MPPKNSWSCIDCGKRCSGLPTSSRVNCKGQTKPLGDLCEECDAIDDETEQVKEADQKMHAVAAKAAAESEDWEFDGDVFTDAKGAEALKAANRMQTDEDD